MPTENRSSNTVQMISVPRDEVERLVKLLQYQAHPCPSPHAEFWQGLLDAPAVQHQADGFSAGDMADQGAKAFAARDPEVNELRAQLAEAQEVLRDCIEVGELDLETQWKAERVSKGRRLYVDDRALASIADPSAPIERDQGIPGTSFQRLNMLANQGE